MIRLISFAIAFLLLAGARSGIEAQKFETLESVQSPIVIRVGAIYYDDSAEQYQRVWSLLSALENADRANNKSKRTITFKLVVGTYDEVYHWYRSDQIDLAVMNPGPLALLLKEFGQEEMSKAFIGTRAIIPGSTSIAAEGGMVPRDKYNSILVVNRESLKSQFPSLYAKKALLDHEATQIIDLVFDKARQRQTQFLFVHPFSTSGYIFPRKLLKERTGIDLTPSDYELTYSHNVSLTEIRKSGSNPHGRLRVAFVSDETQTTKEDGKLLIIRSGDLSTPIVQDALVFTPDFVRRESAELARVKELLRASTGQQTFNLTTSPDWWKAYEQVGQWIETFNGEKSLLSTELTLDQIIRRINNYNLHHPDKPARVALVLSGGGAKCAYQLGAVEVLEDKLKQAQLENGTPRPSLDLVVGTSGGAINALTIAAEVTKEDAGRQRLRSTWENFGQSEFLKPSDTVRRLLGLTIGFTFSMLFFNAAYNRHLRRTASGEETALKDEQNTNLSLWSKFRNQFRYGTWSERAGVWLLMISLLLFLISLKPITLTDWLSPETLLRQHVWIHVVEYGGQILWWTAIAIFVVGLILYFTSFLASRQRWFAILSRRLLFPTIVVAILLFFLLPIATIYSAVTQHTLFVSSGIDEKMATEIPKLLNCDASSGPSSQRLANISTDIIKRGLIKRDLVITGSMLSSNSSSRQSDAARQAEDETDLYFIYKTGNSDLPETLRKDNRFVSLKDPANESILLDAVIGSGSIFPAFEPKKLANVKRVMDKDAVTDVSIIDGGFVHNSPIEAAVKLEATHIIMIEASPEYAQATNVNLLSNSVTAFNHLFDQAQLLDARSRRQAEIFTLRPRQDPFLCTMDFGKNYIIEAMKWGGSDARDTAIPRFVRQPRPSGL